MTQITRRHALKGGAAIGAATMLGNTLGSVRPAYAATEITAVEWLKAVVMSSTR